MKIIKVDNFDRDAVSDELIAMDVSERWSKWIVELLNVEYSGSSSSVFFRAVLDDYKLYVGGSS